LKVVFNIETMINNFLSVAKSSIVKNFLDDSISFLHHKDFPFCSYFGINYEKDKILNVKFYVTAFKKVDLNQLENMFPYTKNIKEEYAKYEESKIFDLEHFGTAFILKVNPDMRTSHAFYMKTKDFHEPMSIMTLKHPEPRIVDDYYAVEFNENQSHFKRYYLIKNKDNIKDILQKYAIDFSTEKINFMECLEVNDKHKMTLGMTNQNFINDYIYLNNEQPFLELNNFLNSNLGFHPFAVGKYYSSDVQSVYYMNQGDGVNFKDSLTLLRLRNILNSI